jgi:hypothetical protein
VTEARELTVAETVSLIGVAVIMYSPRREGGDGSGFDRPDWPEVCRRAW